MTGAGPLRDYRVLAHLTGAERSVVAATATVATYPPGQRLITEGEPASGCWLIRSGQVALHVVVPGRGRVMLHTLTGGDILGLSWLVPPHHWHYSATASSAVTTDRLDTDAVLQAAEQDPALGFHLSLGVLEIALGRLQNSRARLLDLYGAHRAG